MDSLKGKTAVITGATSGIGRAIALSLAREGVNIVAVARTEPNLKNLEQEIIQAGTKIRCYCADLSVNNDAEKLAARIQRDVNQVDILAHSAGYIGLGTLEQSPVEELDRHFSVNLRSPYVLTQGLMPSLRKQKGQVVFVNSSVCYQAGKPGLSAYAASKFALKAVAESLREEVNAYGIRVLSVYPGRTASTMQASIHQAEHKPYEPEKLLQPEDIAEQVVHALKLPKTAEVTDISVRPFQKS
jgi:short-subunit dehydrogenase